ncbi:hypothetical protein BGZ94_009683 [Podila epigama]|nr:hypothetical protein BGZ94_009683 [Podila epigama]
MADASLQPLASLQTISQARGELEARLQGIHNDLQLTQTIGLLFVKRQEDLKNAYDQLQALTKLQEREQDQQEQPHETLPPSVREQLALIDKEFQEGQNGILGLKGLVDAHLKVSCPTVLLVGYLVDSLSTLSPSLVVYGPVARGVS